MSLKQDFSDVDAILNLFGFKIYPHNHYFEFAGYVLRTCVLLVYYATICMYQVTVNSFQLHFGQQRFQVFKESVQLR